MIISDSKKFIFIHVPKTSGISIFYALGKFKSRYPNQRGRSIHIKAEELKHELKSNIFDNYFKFSFVRNPWDRIVSRYFHTLKRRKSRYHQHVCSMANFDEYVKWIVSKNPEKMKLLPQYDYLYDDEDNLLMDFVGRFENLEEDFKYICSLLNIHNVELPHRNSSEHRHYSKYYNLRTKRLVYHAYKKDIDTFGYVF